MKALLIIDMQRAYFKTPELIRQLPDLMTNINNLAAKFRKNGDIIINVKTVHARNKQTWTLNMLQDNKGFAFEGSEETQSVNGLTLNGAVEITKTRDSAFQDTQLQALLNEHTVDSLTLAGVSGHSCIFHTAAAAYAYGYPVTVIKDAIGDEDKAQQQIAFEYLRREYRQTIR